MAHPAVRMYNVGPIMADEPTKSGDCDRISEGRLMIRSFFADKQRNRCPELPQPVDANFVDFDVRKTRLPDCGNRDFVTAPSKPRRERPRSQLASAYEGWVVVGCEKDAHSELWDAPSAPGSPRSVGD